MKNKNKNKPIRLLNNLAVLGNTLFVLWIVFNAIDEADPRTTMPEKLSFIGLVALLSLNIWLLLRSRQQP